MKIDRKLNLVIPVERDDGEGTLYVHCTPLNPAVFDRYFMTLSKAWAMLFQQGLNVTAGPRVAALAVKRIAEGDENWEGTEGVRAGFVNEMHRLMNVAALDGDKGWTSIPYEMALSRKLLSEDEVREVEGLATFFILISFVPPRHQKDSMLTAYTSLWNLQTVSSTCTEYASSLTTQTPPDSTGETATASSLPR